MEQSLVHTPNGLDSFFPSLGSRSQIQSICCQLSGNSCGFLSMKLLQTEVTSAKHLSCFLYYYSIFSSSNLKVLADDFYTFLILKFLYQLIGSGAAILIKYVSDVPWSTRSQVDQ